jgi:hypothetical protein
MVRTQRSTTAGSVGIKWASSPVYWKDCLRRCRALEGHDRRDLSESPPQGLELVGKKGDLGRLIGRTKGGMNTKLNAVTDANGRSLSFFMTAGQISGYTGAAALLDELPKAQWLLADRGYDAGWFRDALAAKGM